MSFSEKIRRINLECIAYKAALEEGWSLEQTDDAEFQYRCFLQATLNHPGLRLAPSRQIDRFWHHHILDTQKYMEDCHEVFGRYLHHFPYSGLRGPRDEEEQLKRYSISQKIIKEIAEKELHENGTPV